MSPKPEWIDDYGEVVRLAYWLLDDPNSEWSSMRSHEKLAELKHFLGKPWNYDDEYKLMTKTAFHCADCDAIVHCEGEEEHERCSAGDELRCADCDEDARADAMATSAVLR